jgi:hypothetical protein
MRTHDYLLMRNNMKTYGGSGDIAQLVFTSSLDGGKWTVSRFLGLPFPVEEPLEPTGWADGWALESEKKEHHIVRIRIQIPRTFRQ